MPLKQISSPAFPANELMRHYEAISQAIPEHATLKPFEPGPAGAIVFSCGHLRLVLQYEIQTDSYSARFDALAEIADPPPVVVEVADAD